VLGRPAEASVELAIRLATAMTAPADGDAAEAELVAASRHGDEASFAALVRRHQARVFSLAGRFFRHREDVEEIAQETFLTAWRRLGTYEARAPFEHWITRVCLRHCYARLAARRRREEPLPSTDPAAAGHEPAAAIDLERLLARLSPADRFVLLLLDGEGWSAREIAERVGWTVANVKVRAFRARRRLRRVLEEGS
jgi:RNA polymerase sigma-70 factor (ECF subfamily)